MVSLASGSDGGCLRHRDPVAYAGSFLKPRIPSPKSAAVIRNGEIDQVSEDQPANDGDVRHSESVADDEIPCAHKAIKMAHATQRPIALAQAPVSILVQFHVGAEACGRVMEIGADRVEEFDLRALRHHVDQPFLKRRLAGEDGIADERVQILCDRGAFRDERPIFEFQHRQRAE